jgi:hypothetical protein
MSKYRQIRVKAQADGEALVPEHLRPLESRVIEIAPNEAVPFRCVGVENSTPLADWADYTPTDGRKPDAVAEEEN